MSVALKKVTTQNDDELFVLSDHEDQKEIRLHIFNIKNQLSYIGIISDIQLRSMAAELRMMYNVYVLETVNALAGENNESQYNYTLEKAEDIWIFKWKKIVENESIKVTLGEVKVEKKDFNVMLSEMLSFISNELIKQKANNEECCLQIHEGQKSFDETCSLLDDTLSAKEEFEKSLYSKFAIVLNNKKRKIKELIETIEEMKEENSKKVIKSNHNKQNSTANKKITPIDLDEAGPSSEVCKRNLDFDLNFGDNDSTPPKRQTKRLRKKPESVLPAASTSTAVLPKRTRIKQQVSDSDEDIDAMLENL